MSTSPDFIFLSQATSSIIYDLARTVARELGPTLLISGNTFDAAGEEGLEQWQAPSYDNTSYKSRLKTWSHFVADALLKSGRIRGKPVMLVNSNPPMGPWLAYLLKKTRGWKYLVRVLDVYPNAITGSGLLGEQHPVVKGWRGANRLAYDAADHIITLGPVMADRVASQTSGRDIEIIPDWVNPSEIKPCKKSKNPFAQEHGFVDGLNVLYSGNLGITHDISGLSGAAENLSGDPTVRFVLIGGGGRSDEFVRLGERLQNVHALPFQPASVVPNAMACGDVGIVTLGRGAEGVSMPSKAYYMMAAGCALLGLSYGDNDLARLISDNRCGINVRADDAAGVRKAVERFRDDSNFLETCQRNARAAAESKFSAEGCIPQYIELLQHMRVRATGVR